MTTPWPDTGTLTTIASVTMAFSASMLFFRMQREHSMQKQGEPNWIPLADWLLIWAGMISLVLVILPTVATHQDSSIGRVLPPTACAVSSMLVAGYTPAILAHYRLLWRGNRTGPRHNPEPAERWVVIFAVTIAIVTGAGVAWVHIN